MPKTTGYANRLIKSLRILGINVEKEVSDGHKHVDIVIPDSKIDIEVDGRQHLTDSHQILSDLERSHKSQLDGFDTLHVPNNAIYDNLGGVASAIAGASAIKAEENKLDDNNGNCKLCGHAFDPHLIIALDTDNFSKGGIMKCPVENCSCHRTVDFNLKIE